jgi:GTP cyclohydrolase IA
MTFRPRVDKTKKTPETQHFPGLLERLRGSATPYAANDTIADQLRPGDLEVIEQNVAAAFEGVLDALVIDRDHNTQGTACRVAKMYVRELFAGRYQPPPPITDFPNIKKLDELYTVGPITVRSTCSHHFCSVTGRAWIGVVPGERLIGLSKFNRLVEWVLARPQIQEEAVVQLADVIAKLIKPRGLGVVIKASHSCMTLRGVKDGNTVMTTSVVRGVLFDDPKARAEFFNLIGGP